MKKLLVKLRLIVTHDPETAAQASAKRDGVIAELEKKAAQWTNTFDDQYGGKRRRGRKLSDGGARARFYHEVCDEHLTRIVQVDLKSELFTYALNKRTLAHARMMDGKLLLVSNTRDLAPPEVVRRYKSLSDIELGFRILKSEIEIGPIKENSVGLRGARGGRCADRNAPSRHRASDEPVVERRDSGQGELGARLRERLFGHRAQQFGLSLQVAKKRVELGLNAHAYAGQHERYERRQRQLAAPRKRRRVLRMSSGLKEFGGQ